MDLYHLEMLGTRLCPKLDNEGLLVFVVFEHFAPGGVHDALVF